MIQTQEVIQSIEYISERDNVGESYISKLIKADDGKILDKDGNFITRPKYKHNGKNLSVQAVVGTLSNKGTYDIWTSDVQKSIRRGEINKALYGFLVLAGMGGQYTSHIMNRVFKVIVMEDLFGSPLLIISCSYILSEYNENKTYDFVVKNWKEISSIITLMCNSYKSRIVDLIIHYTGGDKVRDTSKNLTNNQIKDIFDIMVDELKTEVPIKHKLYNINDILSSTKIMDGPIKCTIFSDELNKKLSRKRKIVFYFFYKLIKEAYECSTSLYKSNEVKDFLPQVIESILDLYCLSNGENKLCIFHAYVLFYYFKKGIVKIELLNKTECNLTIDEVLAFDIVPDYSSIDKHTKLGKKAKIGIKEFYLHGCKISKPYPPVEDDENKFYRTILKELCEDDKDKSISDDE